MYALKLIIAGAVVVACSEQRLPSAPLAPGDSQTARGDATTREYFVTPDGRATGNGTRARPWDLASALRGAGGSVHPGDVIWLRGGAYAGVFTSTVSGSPAAPVTIRAYPGERATIDGGLIAKGSNVTYWGFEVMQSNPWANTDLSAIETRGANERFVNLVIHDAGNQGVTFGYGLGNSELYGSIIYNNGTEPDKDHGVYVTNDGGGTKLVADNIVFNNLAYGLHAYAGTDNHSILTDVQLEGNAAFNNGTLFTSAPDKSNLMMAADVPVQNAAAVGNMLYMSKIDNSVQNFRLGMALHTDHPKRENRSVVARDNYVVGGATGFRMEHWLNATIRNNTFLGGEDRAVRLSGDKSRFAGYDWGGNAYHGHGALTRAWNYAGTVYTLGDFRLATGGLGAADEALADLPTQAKIFVRANKYEAGRANIVVYNWGNQQSVAVNPASVLKQGDHFEIRNAQDFYGAAVVSGVYVRGMIQIPMAGVLPPAPLGATGARMGRPTRTGPAFDVFVLTTRASPARHGGDDDDDDASRRRDHDRNKDDDSDNDRSSDREKGKHRDKDNDKDKGKKRG